MQGRLYSGWMETKFKLETGGQEIHRLWDPRTPKDHVVWWGLHIFNSKNHILWKSHSGFILILQKQRIFYFLGLYWDWSLYSNLFLHVGILRSCDLSPPCPCPPPGTPPTLPSAQHPVSAPQGRQPLSQQLHSRVGLQLPSAHPVWPWASAHARPQIQQGS